MELLLWCIDMSLFAAARLAGLLSLWFFLGRQLLALGGDRHERLLAGGPPVRCIRLILMKQKNVNKGFDES